MDSLFSKALSKKEMDKLEKKHGLPPKDDRLKRLDPSSPFYQDGIDLLLDNPEVSPEKLKAMAAPMGITIDLLPPEEQP